MKLKHTYRKLRYRIVAYFFKDIVQDLLTDAIHPEFGWVWHKGEIGHKFIHASYLRGLVEGSKYTPTIH